MDVVYVDDTCIVGNNDAYVNMVMKKFSAKCEIRVEENAGEIIRSMF